jgi:hypothetical protein
MPKNDGKKSRRSSSPPIASRSPKAAPWLPKKESIISEKMFTSPKGRRYRVLTTTETDAYDQGGDDKDDDDRDR